MRVQQVVGLERLAADLGVEVHDPATKQRFQEEKDRFGVRDEEILFDSLLNELKALVSISPP